MPPLEPNWALAGELLLATSGLWPSKPLLPKDAAAAMALPKEWAEEIEKLLEGKPRTKPPSSPEVRFLATWKRLNDDEGFEGITALVENKKIASAYEKARNAALGYLTERLEPVMVDDLQQTRWLEPSIGQQFLANQLVATANDPGRVVYSLRAGLVAADAVDLVREVYPAIDALVQNLVSLELQRQRARRASYRVPWSAESVLRAYLGEPIGTAAPEAPEEAQAAGPPPGMPEVPTIDIRRNAEEAQTRTDRLTDLDL